ncbi:MAG: hypothetical protein K9K62_00385 [Desulfobacteraceae bacterium]|nr:hypothetical protein [Desulfobacteraceae bacterium]
MKKLLFSILITGILMLFVSPGFGMGTSPAIESEMVARAKVDECFNGIGEPFEPGPECGRDEKPKCNQSYLWGLTKAGNNLWFGTAANMLCLVRAYSAYSQGGNVSAYENDLWLCEYDQGRYPETEMANPVPQIFSDYRPPKIYTYNINTKTLTDKSAQIMDENARMLLESTFGLRSAGAIDGLVFLAGPVALGQGINMFVFDAETGGFLGAKTIFGYQNIRKWLVMDGVLYAAVAEEGGGGKVLRWTGSRTNPFSFEQVGSLTGAGAEITAHNGRIFVGTWPSSHSGDTPVPAGIWMSPKVPEDGLSGAHLNDWQKVWQTDEYEPDPLNAAIYGVGAMKSFDGHLYWGTMHVHGKAALVFMDQYNMSPMKLVQTYFNSWRATSIFRGRNFGGDKDVELLYGNRTLPVYVSTGESSGYWTRRENNMGGISGKYGRAGFGNEYNNYAWTMEVYDGQLFVGTMDHSYLWLDWNNLQRGYINGEYYTVPLPDIPWYWTPSEEEYGADLWRFPSSHEQAVRATRSGLGNYTNYGFRSIVSDEETGLYLGTANPANINRDRYSNMNGGWELHRVFTR